MATGVEFDFSSFTGFLHDAQAYVSSSKVSSGSLWSPAVLPTNPKPRKQLDGKTYSPWGPDNNFPQQVIDLVSKSTVAPAALQFKIKSLYGKGIVPCLVSVDASGQEQVQPYTGKEVVDFFKVNNLRKLLLEMITDYVWFGNVFPEIILNKRRTRIVRIFSNEAAYCRWEKIDLDTGRILHCYVSANWPNPRVSEIVKVSVLDPYDTLASLRDGSEYKYIVPVNLPSPGKSYYQLVPWDGARSNGWIVRWSRTDISRMRPSIHRSHRIQPSPKAEPATGPREASLVS